MSQEFENLIRSLTNSGDGSSFKVNLVAGGVTIGTVDIDQSNPGVSNGVYITGGSISATNPSVSTTGTAIPASATMIGGSDGTNLRALKADTDGTLNEDLTKVGGSAFSLGQQLAAASLPVVLTAAQITTLTPPTTVTVVQPTGSNLHADIDSLPALPAGTNIIGKVDIDQTTPGTTNGVVVNSGTLTAVTSITNALPAGTNIIGKVDIDQTTPGTTNGVVVNSGTLTAVTSITNALPAGTNLLGKVGIDQTTPGTTNKVSIGTDGTVAINAAIPAGGNFIGDVGGSSITTQQNPTISTSAYSSGYVVGGLLTMAVPRVSGKTVTLQNVEVLDTSAQKAALTIMFFSQIPSAATYADHGAFAWGSGATSYQYYLGKIDIAAGDYNDTINSVALASPTIAPKIVTPNAGNIYAVIVTTGTPTYATTTALYVTFGFSQD
jgi:hypothetical protein